ILNLASLNIHSPEDIPPPSALQEIIGLAAARFAVCPDGTPPVSSTSQVHLYQPANHNRNDPKPSVEQPKQPHLQQPSANDYKSNNRTLPKPISFLSPPRSGTRSTGMYSRLDAWKSFTHITKTPPRSANTVCITRTSSQGNSQSARSHSGTV